MDTVRLDEGLLRTLAPSGLTILTERLPGVRSAAIGFWVRTASAHESRDTLGVSHLLEHMVFKGTERRTARQLAHELESRGGSLDAYTGRDQTAFQAHVLDEDLPAAVDVLTDLVRRPLLADADLALERNVVLEEINMVNDTPDDVVFDLHAAKLWGGHAYGYPILGTRETVSALQTTHLRAIHGAAYHPANIVVAAAGNLDHEQLLALLEREGWFAGAPGAPTPPVMRAPAVRGQRHVVERESNQTHIVFGTDLFPHRDPRRIALSIVVTLFGGGMSSRLFQRVREELGLAYGVYAFHQLYRSSGVVGVYVGTQPVTADQATAAILAEYERLARDGLSREELDQGKQQFKGQVMLSLESPASRMNRLATVALHEEEYRPLGRILADIDAVTMDEVSALTAEFFAPERQTILRLGPAGK